MSVEDSTTVFDGAIEQFTNVYYKQVRGHVRQEVIRARLGGLLPSPGYGLDYGGGDGRDSIWATSLGTTVDYWDIGNKIPAIAKKEIDKAGLARSISVLELDPVIDPTPRYDLVMLHGVIQYIDRQKAKELLSKISTITMTGGLISLATKNHDVVTKNHRVQSGVASFSNSYDMQNTAYSAAYLEKWLQTEGFDVVNTRGVRSFSDNDHRNIDFISPDELKAIVDEEAHWSTREDSIEHGHMLHVLARKR